MKEFINKIFHTIFAPVPIPAEYDISTAKRVTLAVGFALFLLSAAALITFMNRKRRVKRVVLHEVDLADAMQEIRLQLHGQGVTEVEFEFEKIGPQMDDPDKIIVRGSGYVTTKQKLNSK